MKFSEQMAKASSDPRRFEMYVEARRTHNAELTWRTLREAQRHGELWLSQVCEDVLKSIRTSLKDSIRRAGASMHKKQRAGETVRAQYEREKVRRFMERLEQMRVLYFVPLEEMRAARSAAFDAEFAVYCDGLS